MLVQEILKSKSVTGTISLPPDAPVSAATTLMSEHRIGTIVVSSDGNSLDGILSERDVVRELGKRGAGCLEDPVSALMTSKIVTCTKEDTALGVLEMMTKGRFRHMPVMENGEMIGLISIGDTVKARLAELAMEKDALEGMIMGH